MLAQLTMFSEEESEWQLQLFEAEAMANAGAPPANLVSVSSLSRRGMRFDKPTALQDPFPERPHGSATSTKSTRAHPGVRLDPLVVSPAMPRKETAAPSTRRWVTATHPN